ncbi:TPA: hypothetical protein ACH3X1_005162 [Trebouxia sp. C0004]
MSPSAYFKAADVVKDNVILIAYAHFGFQAAVVINRHEWDTKKQRRIVQFSLDAAKQLVVPGRMVITNVTKGLGVRYVIGRSADT